MHKVVSRLFHYRHPKYVGWMTTKALCLICGVPAREVRQAIQAARSVGAPILSGDRGYKWASNREEAEGCVERLRSRAIEQMKTARDMGGGLDIHFPPADDGIHQMNLEEFLQMPTC